MPKRTADETRLELTNKLREIAGMPSTEDTSSRRLTEAWSVITGIVREWEDGGDDYEETKLDDELLRLANEGYEGRR